MRKRNLSARRVIFRRCCTMYAIIATGGKQYRVSQGDV
ncbi:MAG: 50S ribosomal protein L21, partial [Clostridiales bacterium]|nr:50S ribosomal protein L21 [Clostridiales bacterium]